MKRIKYLLLTLLSIVTGIAANASPADSSVVPPAMMGTMYENGKIFVVITVIGIIFTGIIIYLFLIDRKLTKLEKK